MLLRRRLFHSLTLLVPASGSKTFQVVVRVPDFGLTQPRVPVVLSVADIIKLEYTFSLVPKP